MELNYMKHKAVIFEKLSEIETLPEQPENVDKAQLKKYKYPFSRNLNSYKKKLPDLEVSLKNNISILDIGAGNGIATGEIQKQYNAEITATGLTSNTECSVPFVIASSSDLPFPDNSFDLVISVQAISWEFEQQRAIREVFRILKPGATALLYFTLFSFSVEHYWGEDIWDEIGITKREYIPLEFDPSMRLPDDIQLSVKKTALRNDPPQRKNGIYVKITKTGKEKR